MHILSKLPIDKRLALGVKPGKIDISCYNNIQFPVAKSYNMDETKHIVMEMNVCNKEYLVQYFFREAYEETSVHFKEGDIRKIFLIVQDSSNGKILNMSHIFTSAR
jgi:hypothetical protein